jgi:hypothetical protein
VSMEYLGGKKPLVLKESLQVKTFWEGRDKLYLGRARQGLVICFQIVSSSTKVFLRIS